MNRENFKVYKACIIGDGFSGLVTAIALANRFKGEDIILLERNDRVGKKILSTGNGQCNLTNLNLSADKFHGAENGFVDSVLADFSNDFLIKFFKNLGVYTVLDGDKYYPMSKQASAVLDALRFKVNALNVNVKLNSLAIGTNRENNFVTTLENGEKIYSQNLVIATGGKSAKHTGSDGNGYNLAKSFGHSVTLLYPSLVQLKCNANSIKGLKGLKQFSSVTSVVDGKSVYFTTGDVLFTDYGVSGNAIFQVSSYLAGEKNKSIVIDLCPSITESELTKFLNEKIKNCAYLKLEDLFAGVINKKVAFAVLKNSLNADLSSDIKNVDVVSAVKAVKNFTLNIIGDTGFDNSQVTRGGVSVESVDNKTMQSKLVKGLYFTGEILNVDGDCGGYNLQWAFSSALAVANSIK